MPKPQGIFFVASLESSIVIKIEGFATQNNSIFFKDFVDEMLESGFIQFVIDLSECRGIDSTFMGVLVKIVHYVEDRGISTSSPIIIINTTPYHRKLLDNLGLLNILPIKEEILPLPNIEMKKLIETNYDPIKRIKLIQEAHQSLAKLNEGNKQKFGHFLELLEEEMKEKSQI